VDNAAHLHLLVNHFPIIGAFLAIPLLVLALLLRRERGLLLASVFLLVAVAVSGWLSIQTGEKAMDMMERDETKPWGKVYDAARTQGDVDFVDLHEERAQSSMWFAVPTAVAGLVVLVLAHRRQPDNPMPRIAVAVLLVGAVATGAAMARVGNAGGVIMHREIRGDGLDTTTKGDSPAGRGEDGHREK
jgi:hypothetical protein